MVKKLDIEAACESSRIVWAGQTKAPHNDLLVDAKVAFLRWAATASADMNVGDSINDQVVHIANALTTELVAAIGLITSPSTEPQALALLMTCVEANVIAYMSGQVPGSYAEAPYKDVGDC